MKEFYRRKKILVTGGTGSLGRVLIKKLKGWDCTLIVYSRDEGKQALFFGNDSSVIRVIGDVRDLDKLDTTMQRYQPHYVIHTGALKRIDDMEFFPDECVKTNVIGSENVATAALRNNVGKCILISTDKACQPVNVYGATKFVAERIFTNFDYNSKYTIYSSVRYGNVIGSRGSFIPLWLSQIEANQNIRVTSIECSRFLFTLEDAVDTVLGALKYSEGGEIFVPKITSYTMQTIINALKIITGYNVTYEISGMRPGEKFHEDILAETEVAFTRDVNSKLLVVLPQYTNRKHSFNRKYSGNKLNSALKLNSDSKHLASLIIKGLNPHYVKNEDNLL